MTEFKGKYEVWSTGCFVPKYLVGQPISASKEQEAVAPSELEYGSGTFSDMISAFNDGVCGIYRLLLPDTMPSNPGEGTTGQGST